ncbi:unnamed protein product [Protopolystoma xenopodis]|uniref:Uncharacterized protein n=1 Tax=Protopolystoma xenopodis TaxID=117903 RepID=A0A448XC88_9PLAT|nr:unnamed protein product [Protopolystoma xenopodis]
MPPRLKQSRFGLALASLWPRLRFVRLRLCLIPASLGRKRARPGQAGFSQRRLSWPGRIFSRGHDMRPLRARQPSARPHVPTQHHLPTFSGSLSRVFACNSHPLPFRCLAVAICVAVAVAFAILAVAILAVTAFCSFVLAQSSPSSPFAPFSPFSPFSPSPPPSSPYSPTLPFSSSPSP